MCTLEMTPELTRLVVHSATWMKGQPPEVLQRVIDTIRHNVLDTESGLRRTVAVYATIGLSVASQVMLSLAQEAEIRTQPLRFQPETDTRGNVQPAEESTDGKNAAGKGGKGRTRGRGKARQSILRGQRAPRKAVSRRTRKS